MLKRIIAYLIDILLVSLIVQGLANTTIFNPNLNMYQKLAKDYNNKILNYQKFLTQLSKDYEDKKLEEQEYNNLIEKYPTYKETLEKYYVNNTLKEKDFQKLIKEINKTSEKEFKKLYYKVEKNSISEKIIYIVIVILYFVIFNYVTDGQTLGKKVMKLKIVNNQNDTSKVSLLNYSLRAFILYQGILYVTRLIGIITLNGTDYYNLITIASQIQSIVEIMIFAMILMRKDKRGLHDIIAKTRVTTV